MNKFLIVLMMIMSANAQVMKEQVDESLIKEAFAFEIYDKDFNLHSKNVSFEAKLLGTHTFIGPEPSRAFADNRTCKLDISGVITHDIFDANTLRTNVFSKNIKDFISTPDVFIKNVMAFEKQTFYKGLNCEKSIIRLNSLRKLNTRRIKNFRDDFKVFALNEIFNNTDFWFLYPKFELSDELQDKFDKYIVHLVFNRIYGRDADEYELIDSLGFNQEENWGYILQENIAEKSEFEFTENIEEKIEKTTDRYTVHFNRIEDFWLDHCLNADTDYIDFTSRTCKFEYEEILGLCGNEKNELLELVKKRVHSTGEKCIHMARLGRFGNKAMKDIEEILEDEKSIKIKLQNFANIWSSFYNRILGVLDPAGNLAINMKENHEHIAAQINEELLFEHQLFFTGYTELDDNRFRIILDNVALEPVDFPGLDPRWTDPVNPDFGTYLY